MNLYLRVIIVWIASFFKARMKHIQEVSSLDFRVMPGDLDINMHMNNGRYLTIMDLGRFDFLIRTGLHKLMWTEKSVPILGSAKIRYRLPLMPFQKYKLETEVICWDDKWIYMEQRFIINDNGSKHGAVAAIAMVKGAFHNKSKRETVHSQHLLDTMGEPDAISPPIPTHIEKWMDAEDALKERTK